MGKLNKDKSFVGYWYNTGSALLVLEVVHGVNDSLIIGWENSSRKFEKEIKETGDGRSYITFCGRAWYMSDCIRKGGAWG